VRRSSLAAISAAVALGTCVAGGIVAGPAFAYPPGMALAVKATPIGQPDKHQHQQFAIAISNGKTGCKVKITGGERPVVTAVRSDGTATATIESKYRKGTAKITAKTLGCSGAKEKASDLVTLSPGEVHSPARAKHGRRVDITLEHWLPHRRISVVATNGRRTQKLTGWPDRNGTVSVHFTPEKKGVWAIIVRQDGASTSTTITAY
jgi:hypothetical protein